MGSDEKKVGTVVLLFLVNLGKKISSLLQIFDGFQKICKEQTACRTLTITYVIICAPMSGCDDMVTIIISL